METLADHCRYETEGSPVEDDTVLNLILIILVILLLGGGGYGVFGGNASFGPSFGYGFGGLGTILLIVLVVILLRGA